MIIKYQRDLVKTYDHTMTFCLKDIFYLNKIMQKIYNSKGLREGMS